MKTIAILTLKKIPANRRQEIAAWLRRQANSLTKDGAKYSPRFRARFITT